MALIPRNRIWITAMAIALAALAGATSGLLLGRDHTLHVTETRLAGNAAKLEGLLDAFMKESGNLLNELNASKYPPCSQAEMEWMRQLIFHSTFLRDAGHMHNGTLECSAGFGREGLPRKTSQPSATLGKDYKVYTNLPPYASGHWPVFLIQRGESFVVEDPEFENYWQQIDKDYDVYIPIGSAREWIRPSGARSRKHGSVVNRDWQGKDDDWVYATRCALHSPSCTMVYASYAAALAADREQLALTTALGAVIGVLVVLIYLLIYHRSHRICQQLRRDIRRDKLHVLYQPIVELATRRIVEAEALVRWTDASGTAVSPDVFVCSAEECGFVGELTELVVRHALRDFGGILRGNPEFRLNINVTASDLADPRFLPMLEHWLTLESVAPRSLAIEVTESSTARQQEAIEAIRQLRRRGHSVQIDDFGTGYSSLAYLKDLAVDAIKIDKAFTRTIGTNAVIGHILPQILAMAESLDLMVIAEGIETQEQADYFAACTRPVLGQGWLFGRPVSAAVFLAQLAADITSAD